jgi:hypothetical protein
MVWMIDEGLLPYSPAMKILVTICATKLALGLCRLITRHIETLLIIYDSLTILQVYEVPETPTNATSFPQDQSI